MPKHHFRLGDLVVPRWNKKRDRIGLIVGSALGKFDKSLVTSYDVLIDDKVYFYWEHDLNPVGPMQSTPEPDKINSPRRQK